MNDDLPKMSSYAGARMSSYSIAPPHDRPDIGQMPGAWLPGDRDAVARRITAGEYGAKTQTPKAKPKKEKTVTKEKSPSLRIVRVFLVDPDERIDVEKRLLHRSDEMVTDAIDEELFHEINVRELLDHHNEYRKTVRDKTVKNRTEHLDSIRIRDLSMVVATIAEF